jgi:hypothetical protein
MNVLEFVKPYLKAVVGFAAPGIGTLIAAVLGVSPGGERITQAEWIVAFAICFTTSAAVWGTPNLPRKNKPRGPDSVSAPDDRPPTG